MLVQFETCGAVWGEVPALLSIWKAKMTFRMNFSLNICTPRVESLARTELILITELLLLLKAAW
jgi:hypothetical protein